MGDDWMRTVEPAVELDGDTWIALLGADLQTGIVGLGATREDAIEDWRRAVLRYARWLVEQP